MPYISRTSIFSPALPAIGTPSDASDIITPVDVLPVCDECESVAMLPNILCPDEVDWCCLTSGTNEVGEPGNVCGDIPYCQPVVDGQCLNFQFQFQNTLNRRKPISWAQWLSSPQTIQYGWYHPSTNPTNWTIRMRIIDANGNEVPNPESYIQQASVYLLRDDNASTGFPLQAWYRWVQQIQICLPSRGTFATDNFYIEFEVRDFGWTTGDGTKYRTEQYCYHECEDDCDKPLTTIEGVWDEIDCWGQYYGLLKPALSQIKYNGTEIPPRVLSATFMYSNRPSQHRHTVVIQATFRLDGFEISKEIPDGQCIATQTTSNATYHLKGNVQFPPYMARLLGNAFSAQQTVINNNVQVHATGLNRNDSVGSMFEIDENLTGCPCVIDLSCK